MSIRQLVGRLNPLCKKAFEESAHLCVASGHFSIDIPHILIHILREKNSDMYALCTHYGIDVTSLIGDLERLLQGYKKGNNTTPSFSPHVLTLLENAWLVASVELGVDAIQSGAFLYVLLDGKGLLGWCAENLAKIVSIPREKFAQEWKALLATLPEGKRVLKSTEKGAPQEGAPVTEYLDKYTIDLTQQAREGKLAPVWGRDKHIRQVIDVLARIRQNNPILVGEAGVGKTAVVEGLAHLIVSGNVPDFLTNVTIRVLDVGLLEAGAGVQGEFENRLKNIINEIQEAPFPIVLFVDEAHMLMGGEQSKNDAANLLKPFLARGELQTIAATTWNEYKKYFEKDAAMTRRFQPVSVDEPSDEEAVRMLRALVDFLQEKHECRILNDALRVAVALSRRYIGDRRLPDKAVSVLDTACARVKISQKMAPLALEEARRHLDALQHEKNHVNADGALANDAQKRLRLLAEDEQKLTQAIKDLEAQWKKEQDIAQKIQQLQKKPGNDKELEKLRDTLSAVRANAEGMVFSWVCGDNVAQVVASWTGVPVGKMLKDESKAFLQMASTLSKRVVGQDGAILSIADTMMTHKAHLDDPDKPLGVFFLAGPSGVGKTETAHALAEYFFGGERNTIVVNMSEYQEAHTVSLLRGSPPGYVGYGHGGVLTEAVRRQPYSVVLLDELEKAHTDVIELFYQVFDKGVMEDGSGVRVDFKNTLIIMTSNLGTEAIVRAANSKKNDMQTVTNAVMDELGKHFKPAFLARVAAVPYYPLSVENVKQVVDIKWCKVQKRVQDHYGVNIELDKAARKFLETSGCNEDSGARAIDACIHKHILPAVAKYILHKQSDGQDVKDLKVTCFNQSFSVSD